MDIAAAFKNALLLCAFFFTDAPFSSLPWTSVSATTLQSSCAFSWSPFLPRTPPLLIANNLRTITGSRKAILNDTGGGRGGSSNMNTLRAFLLVFRSLSRCRRDLVRSLGHMLSTTITPERTCHTDWETFLGGSGDAHRIPYRTTLFRMTQWCPPRSPIAPACAQMGMFQKSVGSPWPNLRFSCLPFRPYGVEANSTWKGFPRSR